jgi:pyruvate kinase
VFVLTISPRSVQAGQLAAFQELGLRGLRVNFGRNSLEENVELLHACRAAERELDWRWTIWTDLPGAKMRLGPLAGGRLALAVGQAYWFDRDVDRPGDHTRGAMTGERLHAHTVVGDHLVTGGGALLEVVERRGDELGCRVISAGDVYSRCGIAWVDRYVPSEGLSDDDRAALAATTDLADVVCPSFVDDPAIVAETRDLLPPDGPAIVAKIESPLALDRLAPIAAAADGVMLARGDLQNTYTLDQIDALAPAFVRTARANGSRVVLATDYFKSMVGGPTLSDGDRAALERALALSPDAVVVNETAYAEHWREIAAEARRFEDALGAAPSPWRPRPRTP